jgi:outer membrane immunogenic protein
MVVQDGRSAVRKTMMVFAAAGLAAAAVSTAFADGPYPRRGSTKNEAVYARPFSWTGFYVGAQVGRGWGDTSTIELFPGTTPFGQPLSWDHQGWFGGGYVGANWQSGALVLGVEADWNRANIEGGLGPGFFNSGINTTLQSEVNSFGSLRARLGWAADRWLLFATGGWAWAHAAQTEITTIPPPGPASVGGTFHGWTVGAGVEYSFASNVVGRLEYRHYDFGDKFLDFSFPTLGYLNRRFDFDFDTVSVGVAYTF